LEIGENIMSETAVLSELQIKRRELENELASLSQSEKSLKNDLKTLEEKIIGQLEEEIKAKKLALSGLESRKSDLERKLNELQGKPVDLQTTEEQHANGETEEPVQQNATEENDTELTVVECQPEQTEETVQSTKEDDKSNWVF
jgi:chromosome segregation ATPase